ncbi:MAG: pilus assembly protein [Phenylobacterium sp.]
MHPFRPENLRSLPRRWAGNASGGTAITFALVFTFLVAPLTTIAVDLFLFSSQRAKLQDALDAATLWAARANTTRADEIQALGARALTTNLVLMSKDPAQLRSSTFLLETDAEGQKVTGSAVLDPYTIFNWCHEWTGDAWCLLPDQVEATSEVRRGIDAIEVALVLDNTGSMQSEGRLAALKTAAKAMVDDLAELASRPNAAADAVKISLVPFSSTVRIRANLTLTSYDTTTHSGGGVPDYMDGRARAIPVASDLFSGTSKSDRFALLKAIGQPWGGCVESRNAPFDVDDTAPNPSDPATLYIPYFWPDEADNPSSGNKPSYNDYLADGGGSDYRSKLRRVQKYSTTTLKSPTTFTSLMDSTLYGGPYNRGPNAGCPVQPMIPLTTTLTSVKTAIDGMTAMGETHIPIGLAWGWNTLSPTGPVATGAAYSNDDVKKFVVLMTDGDNTMNQISRASYGNTNASLYGSYGYVWQGRLPDPDSTSTPPVGMATSSSSADRTAAIDERLALLCSNIKARNIVIYVVGLKVSAASRSRLQACASGGSYWDVDDVSDLTGAFAAIAASIKDLRISR